MDPKRLMLVAAVAAAIFFAALAGAEAQNRGARPTKAAVVDVEKVFSSLQEKVQVEADLQTKGERLKQEEEQRKNEIRQVQNDLSILAPGTPAYQEKQEKLETGVLELQAWQQFQTAKLQRERSIQIENLYRKLLNAIGGVARDNGYDMVLYKEKPAEFGTNVKPEALSTLIQVRKVLWSADDLDITDQVVTKMNNEYKNK